MKFFVRRSWLSLALALGLLAGLLAAKFGYIVSWMLLATCCVLFLLLHGRWQRAILLILIGIQLGVWAGMGTFRDLNSIVENYGQNLVIAGKVSNDPAYHSSGQLEFRMNDLNVQGRDIQGTLVVRGYVNDLQRHDRVSVRGKLREGFGSIQGYMSYAQVTIQARDYSFLAHFRRSFIAISHSILPDPESSLSLGFLLGVRSVLPDTLSDQLRITGLTHIVAVSGYNLTILVRLMRRALARFSLYLSMLGAATLLGSFLMLTDNSPSIQRASIVAGMSLLGHYYGMPFKPIPLLIYSAAISAMVNPLNLWYDIGWYLSFTAFFGVLVIAPNITAKIYKHKQPKVIGATLVETTAAQLTTLPVMLFVFGSLSVVSLPANLIVLPMIPVVMLGGFVSGIVAHFSIVLASIIAWPTQVLLEFMLNILRLLSFPSWAQTELFLSGGGLFMAYGIIVLLWFALHRAARDYQKIDPHLL